MPERLETLGFRRRRPEETKAMSLELLQGYSSAEEANGEDEDYDHEDRSSSSSSSLDDDDDAGVVSRRDRSNEKRRTSYSAPIAKASPNPLLLSALDAFSEVSGPPEFLNKLAGGDELKEEQKQADWRGRGRKKEKKDLPVGAVLESKAQLVGIRDRVRSDVEGSGPSSGSRNKMPGEGKRIITASNPEAKDAADLLRMCVQCGIPKTYSHTRGMVCPQCSDRPPPDPMKEPEKKKGSTIKDKEKSKRMRGQSSHATWKSETEMQLRQQFD